MVEEKTPSSFFDVKASDLLKVGADAFMAKESTKTANADANFQVAKTAEANILAQAQAVGDQALMWADQNKRTLFLAGGVLVFGYFVMNMKRSK